MAGSITHLAIADKIYDILGNRAIKNLPLFFGGNLAPDAVYSKKDYNREDKKRSHLYEEIKSYGYGYPEMAELFHNRVNEFIENYYLTAGEEKDLYLGYIVHLLVDELFTLTIIKHLEEYLKNKGADINEPAFRKNLADSISNDPAKYNEEYVDFFSNISKEYDILPHEYPFKQNIKEMLEAAWDYEVKDYIGAAEINANKHWLINKYFQSELPQDNIIVCNRDRAIQFIDLAAENVIEQLLGKGDIIKIL
jgi:hypothetical protein